MLVYPVSYGDEDVLRAHTRTHIHTYTHTHTHTHIPGFVDWDSHGDEDGGEEEFYMFRRRIEEEGLQTICTITMSVRG
jgi:hypothetical protein